MVKQISFGQELKSLRVKKDWTQKETAELLKIGERTYKGWESDERVPHKHLKSIAALFGLDEAGKAALYDAADRVVTKINTIPFRRNHFFTGRQIYLQWLEQMLQENGSVAISQSVSISGLGGIGKTQLALEYAHRSHSNVYRAVFWMEATDEPTLQAEYDFLAQLLELPESNSSSAEIRVQAVKQLLEDCTKWLLVLDNADDLHLVSRFLPAKPRGHIIVTTRSQMVSALGTKAMQIEIEAMEPADSLFFLLKRAGLVEDEVEIATIATDVRDTARELVALLGGHSLALDQAGAYVEETGTTFADYIQLYQKERGYLLHRRGLAESKYSDYPASAAATIALSFKQVCERQPLAEELLYFCSFLQPDTIPEKLVYRADGLKFSTSSFNEAIAAVQRQSLMKRNVQEKQLSMHRLVQQTLIDTLSLDLKKQWFLRVQRTLSTLAHEEELRGEDPYDPMKYYSHAVHLPGEPPDLDDIIATRFPLFRQAEAAIRYADAMDKHPFHRFAEFFLRGEPMFSSEERKQSKLKYKEIEFQEQLSRAEKEHDTELDLLAHLSELGDARVEFAKYDQAEAIYERAASIYEHYLRNDNTTVPPDGVPLNDLLNAESMLEPFVGNSPEADLLVCHPVMGHVFYRWAKLSQIQGKYDQAATRYEQALAALARFWDRPNLYATLIKGNYVAFLRSIGREAEAAVVATSLETNLDNLWTVTFLQEGLLKYYALQEHKALRQELLSIDGVV